MYVKQKGNKWGFFEARKIEICRLIRTTFGFFEAGSTDLNFLVISSIAHKFKNGGMTSGNWKARVFRCKKLHIPTFTARQ